MTEADDILERARKKPPAELLTEWLPKTGLQGGIALDLGCGPGAEAEFLAKHGFMVDAIDINATAVKYAKERCEGLKVDVLQGDFREFEYRDAYYDLVFANNALPFVAKDDLVALVSDIRRSLKPGGFVILAVFGTEHAWAGRDDMNFWTMDEFAKFWEGLETVSLEEKKGEMPLASGTLIFQHRIHLIAKKPLSGQAG